MVVLCYHSVHPTWADPIAISPALFAQHCQWLARAREVLPLHDHLRAAHRGRLLHAPVALTFDDGFEDFMEGALPILRRHRMPATLFLVGATIEESSGATWLRPAVDPPPRTLAPDQVLELRDLGFTFGSHSWAHHDLRELGEKECERDLRDSRQIVEDLVREPVTTLAYPYGFHAPHVRRAAAAAGYRYALSLPAGPEPRDHHAVPRVGIYHGNSVTALRIKSRSWYLGLRMSSAHGLLGPAAKALSSSTSP